MVWAVADSSDLHRVQRREYNVFPFAIICVSTLVTNKPGLPFLLSEEFQAIFLLFKKSGKFIYIKMLECY